MNDAHDAIFQDAINRLDQAFEHADIDEESLARLKQPKAILQVSVQVRMAAEGAGLSVMHDFALPSHRVLRKVLKDQVSLTRSFYLVRHPGDQRSERLNRFATALSRGIRDEVARLEGLT